MSQNVCVVIRERQIEILRHLLEPSPFSLEILYRALVLFGLLARGERAQILVAVQYFKGNR